MFAIILSPEPWPWECDHMALESKYFTSASVAAARHRGRSHVPKYLNRHKIATLGHIICPSIVASDTNYPRFKYPACTLIG